MKAKVSVEMMLEFNVVPYKKQEFEERVIKTVESMIAKETKSIQCKIEYFKKDKDKLAIIN